MRHAVPLPRGWAATELGQIRVDLSRTLDPRQYPDEGFELYSVPSFADGEPEIVRGSAIGSTKMTLTPGTVVVCKINPRINRVWVVGDRSPHKKIGSGEWIPFFPVDGVTPHFLAYYLQRDHFRNFLAARVSGVGGSLMRVRPTTLDEYPLPIPSVSEQRRIVEAIESYLTRLDNAVALLERVDQNLKRYRASVLKAAVEGRLAPTEAELARREGRSYEPASDLLKRILAERKTRWIEDAAEKARAKAEEKARKAGKPWALADDAATLKKERAKAAKQYKEPAAPDTTGFPALPEGWCWATVEQLASDQPRSIQSGPFGSSLLHSEFRKTGKLVIGIDNVQDGVFTLGAQHRISERKYESLAQYEARPGDVLVTVMGTVGRCCVVPNDMEPAIITKHVYRVTPERRLALPRFLLLTLRGAPAVRDQMLGQVRGQTRPGLNGTIVRGLAVPLPPLGEQRRVVSECERAVSRAAVIATAIETVGLRASRLRQATLKWAFEGKLVEQDPSDEPASALLERIKAEGKSGRSRHADE